jgi:hypothetical protein
MPFRHARAQLTRLCLIVEHIFRLLSPLRLPISPSRPDYESDGFTKLRSSKVEVRDGPAPALRAAKSLELLLSFRPIAIPGHTLILLRYIFNLRLCPGNYLRNAARDHRISRSVKFGRRSSNHSQGTGCASPPVPLPAHRQLTL